MTKTAMAKASAREQTRSSVALAQSEAESQHQLRQTLEHLALSMATVTTELNESLSSNREILSESTQRAQTALASGITSLQTGVLQIEKVAAQLAKASTASTAQTRQQVDRFRMAALATTFGLGLLVGVILLSLLLILRPPAIQAFWTVAQALRN